MGWGEAVQGGWVTVGLGLRLVKEGYCRLERVGYGTSRLRKVSQGRLGSVGLW